MLLKDYKEAMENKELLNITFSVANNTDHVFTYKDDEIEVRMEYQEFFIRANDDATNEKQAAGAVRKPKTVLVKKIDEENNIVYVSYIDAMKLEREKKVKEIDARLEAGEQIRVKGRVVDVRGEKNRSYAVIAFNDSTVRGVVWCNHWSPSYTIELRGKDLIGMEVEVLIVEKIKNTRATHASYVCVRDVLMDDIWNGIEEKYHKGDVVNVKCVEKWDTVYAGFIEGEKEMKVRMVLPDKKTSNGLMLVPNLIYQCIVISVNEKEKKFRVRPERLCLSKPGVRKVTIIT